MDDECLFIWPLKVFVLWIIHDLVHSVVICFSMTLPPIQIANRLREIELSKACGVSGRETLVEFISKSVSWDLVRVLTFLGFNPRICTFFFLHLLSHNLILAHFWK